MCMQRAWATGPPHTGGIAEQHDESLLEIYKYLLLWKIHMTSTCMSLDQANHMAVFILRKAWKDNSNKALEERTLEILMKVLMTTTLTCAQKLFLASEISSQIQHFGENWTWHGEVGDGVLYFKDKISAEIKKHWSSWHGLAVLMSARQGSLQSG